VRAQPRAYHLHQQPLLAQSEGGAHCIVRRQLAQKHI
jgi:hypothetical protein